METDAKYLLKYNAACSALAIAKSVDEAKEIRDKAEAIRAYARQAKNKQLEIDACEIRIRAERRLGEILDPSVEKRGKVNSSRKELLEDQGIDKKLSSRAQRLAQIPDPEFEGRMHEWRENVQQAHERIRTDVFGDSDKHVRGTLGTSENEWNTPEKYIASVRKVLGEIDLDPASSEEAQKIVNSKVFYSVRQDGLRQAWKGKVFLNPPYSQPQITEFVMKLCVETRRESVTEAILLTHNYTDTTWFQAAARHSSAICFTKGRVKFWSPDGQIASPTQGQAFFYFGPWWTNFIDEFRQYGFIVVPK